MAKGGSSTVQQQQVSQSTTVTVQNVIEDKGLEPLERLKLVTEVLGSIDQAQAAKQSGPQTVILQPQVQQSPFSFLQDPKTVILLSAAAAGLIILSKRRL